MSSAAEGETRTVVRPLRGQWRRLALIAPLAIVALVLLAIPAGASAAPPPVTSRVVLGPFPFGCQMIDEGGKAWVYCWEGTRGSTRHVRLDPSGEVSQTATEPVPTGIGGPGVPYGAWLVTGRFRCQLLTPGFECVVISSGKGFLITRTSIREVQAAPGVTEPAPVLGQSAVVETTSGFVSVKEPHTKFAAPLNALTVIPVGSQLDTTQGTVKLTSAASASGETQSGLFRGGIFKFGQPSGKAAAKLPAGLTVLTLTGRPACGARGSASASGAKQPPRLWGNARGNFETEGRYATATVRGTRWLTQDTCTGTLVKVARGVVEVEDLITHRTVSVSAGNSYLASRTTKPTNKVPVLGKPNLRTKGLGAAHPHEISLGGDALSYVGEIHWGNWGAPRAVGHGVAWYLPPGTRSVSEGHSEAATIVAFDLGTCNGKLAYRKLEWFFPAHGGHFKPANGNGVCY